MKDKDWGVKRIELDMPKYAVSCLICNKTIGVYDYPISTIQVCEDCKKAIAYAKKLMEKDNELLRNAKIVYENVDYCYEDLKKAEKRIAELEKENESLKKQLIAIDTLDETNFEKRHNAIVFITKEQLKQFAERLKNDISKKKNKLIKEREIAVKYDDFILIDALAYKIDELQYAIDKIEETLKEFVDD